MNQLLADLAGQLARHWPLIAMMAAVGVLAVIALPNVLILTTLWSMMAGGVLGAGLAIGLLVGLGGGAPAIPAPGESAPVVVLVLEQDPAGTDSRALGLTWRLGTGSATPLRLAVDVPLPAQVGRFLEARATEMTGPVALDLGHLPAGLAMPFRDQAPLYGIELVR